MGRGTTVRERERERREEIEHKNGRGGGSKGAWEGVYGKSEQGTVFETDQRHTLRVISGEAKERCGEFWRRTFAPGGETSALARCLRRCAALALCTSAPDSAPPLGERKSRRWRGGVFLQTRRPFCLPSACAVVIVLFSTGCCARTHTHTGHAFCIPHKGFVRLMFPIKAW